MRRKRQALPEPAPKPAPKDKKEALSDLNDALKQSATTAGMINGVADLVSYLSRVSTLHPGDLITTGNPDAPDFQEKLVPGDVLKAEIEGIGSMNLYVAR